MILVALIFEATQKKANLAGFGAAVLGFLFMVLAHKLPIFDSRIRHGRLLLALCYVHWFEGDFSNFSSVARNCVELGEESGLVETLLLGRFFLGVAHYERDELQSARGWLGSAVADRTRILSCDYSQCVLALAATQLVYRRDLTPV